MPPADQQQLAGEQPSCIQLIAVNRRLCFFRKSLSFPFIGRQLQGQLGDDFITAVREQRTVERRS
jgi:hypothetical protein